MIDKRFGKRVREQRKLLGLTQEQFAEKIGLTPNFISTVERGIAFPRYDKLIAIINGLEVSADAIFCDVVDHSTKYTASHLAKQLEELSDEDQKRILQMVELMIQQAKEKT